MKTNTVSILGALAVLGGSLAFGQQATTVQLPTFDVFSVNTSVLVPDRGSAFLGGVSRGFQGSVHRGFPGRLPPFGPPFAARGFGAQTTASGVSVRTTIIDLNDPNPEFASTANRLGRGNVSQDRHAISGATVVDRIAEIERLHEAAFQMASNPSVGHFEHAARAEAAGQLREAVQHYRHIIAQGDPASRQRAEAGLRNLRIKYSARPITKATAGRTDWQSVPRRGGS